MKQQEKNIIADMNSALSERERQILNKIVQLYILKASPVGSRFLAKNLEEEMKLSAATVRNVMSDLEELRYITHPHTSAGRVPTDKGYRFYVDSLNKSEIFANKEFESLKQKLSSGDSDHILKEASKLLGLLSRYLGFVQFPKVADLIVEKIELVAISSTRLLAVIALDSNIVRTMTLEAEYSYDPKDLPNITGHINEKITGKPLRFLRENFNELISDYMYKDTPIVRLFTDYLDKIFESESSDRILLAGTQNLLNYPEFEDLTRIKSVIELVENEDVIVHLLDKYEEYEGVQILIGKELGNNMFEDYSFVKTSYSIGSAQGSIGLIGPKRMNYAKIISLVQNVSEILSKVN